MRSPARNRTRKLVRVAKNRLQAIAARIGSEGLSVAVQALLACLWQVLFGG
jgi:hypothetical protein